MAKKEVIAMLLAGGQGSRLKDLTKYIAKPAVSFGSKYRIIDFSLTNVSNSHIDTVGVLTQYKPQKLNQYLGTGESWDLDISDGGLHVLPPYATESGGRWYEGTADAIYRNINFVDNYDPEYIVILSGDHIYKMDYTEMLDCHKKNNAELTVAVIKVPMKEASRFGIMTVDKNDVITKFTEKPKDPDSDLASMGIYIFSWKTLRKALIEDHKDKESEHDFGKNIIPTLLSQKKKLIAYEFKGYWMDVGTIQSYYDTQMEFLKQNPPFDIFNKKMRVFSNSNISQPHFIGKEGKLTESLITNGCIIKGEVYRSILSSEAYVDTGAKVDNSILLPGCKIEKGAKVSYAIVGENSVIKAKTKLIGKPDDIALIGDDVKYTEKGGKA